MPDEPAVAPPVPVLTGPDGERLRRFRDKVASGAVVPPVPEGERGVSFVLENSDLNAYELYSAKKSKSWLTMLLIAGAGIAFTFLQMWISPTPRRHFVPRPHSAADTITSIVLSLALPILVFVVLWPIFSRQTKKKYQELGVFDPMTVSISPQGLTARAKDVESRIGWRTIKDIALLPRHLCFQFTAGNGQVVPRYAFKDAAEAESFYAEALGYWESAKNAVGESVRNGKTP